MSPVIAGDSIIDDRQPAQILIVDSSEGVSVAADATKRIGEYLKLFDYPLRELLAGVVGNALAKQPAQEVGTTADREADLARSDKPGVR